MSTRSSPCSIKARKGVCSFRSLGITNMCRRLCKNWRWRKCLDDRTASCANPPCHISVSMLPHFACRCKTAQPVVSANLCHPGVSLALRNLQGASQNRNVRSCLTASAVMSGGYHV